MLTKTPDAQLNPQTHGEEVSAESPVSHLTEHNAPWDLGFVEPGRRSSLDHASSISVAEPVSVPPRSYRTPEVLTPDPRLPGPPLSPSPLVP